MMQTNNEMTPTKVIKKKKKIVLSFKLPCNV